MSSSSVRKLGLVIPTLNESGNMPILLSRIHDALGSSSIVHEVIVVDDESQDGTAEVVRELASLDPRVRLFVRKGQRGLAGAVIHGWEQSDADLLGVIDADLQHPPEVLPSLLAQILNGADIAVASRYVNGNGAKQWSKLRLFISRCGTLATTPLQRNGLHVKDPLSGFFLVRRECIAGLRLQPEGFKILLEILVKGKISKAVEVPFCFGARHSGKSKADLRVALHYFALLGKLSRHALFGAGQQ
jgi:dolichol-phosphate mannosyltransferase